MTRKSGFTLVEVLVCIAVVGALFAVLLPMASSSRNADGRLVSMQNLGKIMQATHAYHFDHAGQAPMRGSRYQNGSLQGWDGWNVGGKNCEQGWSTGLFDESAYSRFLNAYVYGQPIERPSQYLSTGSGATWTFSPGVPSSVQRLQLQIPTFRSPGDRSTAQHGTVIPTPGLSCYDDVGTSYLCNMRWWQEPGFPSGFTAKYNEGTHRIGLALGGANPNFVFMHDQFAELVANAPPGFHFNGEFGKSDASMLGFADGRVAYMRVVTGVASGPGYTFIP